MKTSSDCITHKGLTLIEMLVTISVFMLLIALLLPAVQSARQSAYSIRCKNNLRHLAMAIHSYHEAHRMLPAWRQYNINDPRLSSNVSIHAQILPYLEESTLYDSLNWSRRFPSDLHWTNDDVDLLRTALDTRVSAFICPADNYNFAFPGSVNYRGNWGIGPMWHQTQLFPDSQNGFFSSVALEILYPNRFQLIWDGLGKTAMFSERLVGTSTNGFDRRRTIRMLPGIELIGILNGDDIRNACAVFTNQTSAGTYDEAGRFWLFTGIHHTLYTHAIEPNSPISDCQLFNIIPFGAASARSNHYGGANIVMGDGSAHFISANISLDVWRAMGTRNGADD